MKKPGLPIILILMILVLTLIQN